MAENFITTTELATLLRVKPQSVRRALCLKGHFWGLKPTKMPGGALRWDMDQARALLAGERNHATASA